VSTTDNPITLLDGYVPVIDLGLARERDETHRAAVAQAIDLGLGRSGFLVVTGHSVPQETITAVYAALKEFFGQPKLVKNRWLMDPTDPLYRGFTRITPGIHEQFTANKLGELTPSDGRGLFDSRLLGPNRWPDQPGFRAAYLNYYAAVESFAAELMRLFALALGLPENWFDDKFDRHMTPLTTNYYLAQPTAPQHGELRNAEHRDWGTVTILYQDDAPGGLQVRGRHGEWLNVPPIPGSFVVNLGRLMAQWTNDRWASTLHRVVNPDREQAHRDRISVAFFYQPNPDLLVECVPTCAGETNPPRYAPVQSGEYFMRMVRRAHMQRRLHEEKGRADP
jgi:isopenicillin N synthase-like dioxygenase